MARCSGNPDRAWEMARAMVQELLKTEGANGALLNAIIEVTDDAGDMLVLEFPFAEAIFDFQLAQSPSINHAPSFRVRQAPAGIRDFSYLLFPSTIPGTSRRHQHRVTP